MNSSTPKTTNTLALLKPEQSLLAICELANLRDDPRDFQRFSERWRSFAGSWFQWREPASAEPRDVLRANFYALLYRRDSIRSIWRGGETDKITDLLLPLTEDLASDEVAKYDEHAEDGSSIPSRWSAQIVPDWRRGRLEYKPFTDFQQGLYLLVSNSRLAKVCANPDCLAPYFIAKKATQRYCSDACSGVFQRDCKRRWWAEHGKQWRAKRKKAPSGKTQRRGKLSEPNAFHKKTRGGNS